MSSLPPWALEFQPFLDTSVASIPGWLLPESAWFTAYLTRAQRSERVTGPVLEIGVYKGRYLSVLYKLSEASERVVGVDLFVGAENEAQAMDAVRSNVRAACGEDSRLEVICADSLGLDETALRRLMGGALRFASIDASHERDNVLHDMRLVTPLLAAGGIMALDDVYNHTTPGVTEGVLEFFLRDRPRLAPFAHCYNKLFVTTPDFHGRYLRETVAFAEEAAWLRTREPTLLRRRENHEAGFTPRMFGYEVLPFL